MSRKQKHAGHANHERWLVSYADFITLLFAFFVVMFASSQVDKRKAGRVALAVQVAFQQLGLFSASNAHMALSTSEPMPASQVQLIENAVRSQDLSRIVESQPGASSSGAGRSPTDIQKELEKALAPEIRQHSVTVSVTKGGLVVSLREIGFFDSGSAELKARAEPAVETIARLLKPRGLVVRIEGHTDNVPIHNASFKSNWELSTARATTLVSMFGTRFSYDPALLSAAGYAEYHPVASNATAEGRAMNRRVDIVILSPEKTLPGLMESKSRALPPAANPQTAAPGAPRVVPPVAAGPSSAGGR